MKKTKRFPHIFPISVFKVRLARKPTHPTPLKMAKTVYQRRYKSRTNAEMLMGCAGIPASRLNRQRTVSRRRIDKALARYTCILKIFQAYRYTSKIKQEGT
ncbi:MAG: hypothetical protein ACOYU2_04365 [Nitrospirota bacterium]